MTDREMKYVLLAAFLALVVLGLGLGIAPGVDAVDWVTYLLACAALVAVGAHALGVGEPLGL